MGAGCRQLEACHKEQAMGQSQDGEMIVPTGDIVQRAHPEYGGSGLVRAHRPPVTSRDP
jgi:hypothetical protein